MRAAARGVVEGGPAGGGRAGGRGSALGGPRGVCLRLPAAPPRSTAARDLHERVATRVKSGGGAGRWRGGYTRGGAGLVTGVWGACACACRPHGRGAHAEAAERRRKRPARTGRARQGRWRGRLWGYSATPEHHLGEEGRGASGTLLAPIDRREEMPTRKVASATESSRHRRSTRKVRRRTAASQAHQ